MTNRSGLSLDVQHSTGGNVTPIRTANYHYAAMRRAEDAARSLSPQTSGSFGGSRILPMPGRLPVTRRVRSLPGRGIHIEAPLAEVDTDTMVTATGTVTAVRYLDNKVFGRTMIVLTAEDGNSAHVLFDKDSAYYAEPVLRKGSRIELHGLVTRHIPGQPTGIEGLGVRAVDA